MRILLTLVASSLFLGCAAGFPKFPSIKYQYLVDVACLEDNCSKTAVSCFRFEIVSVEPWKLKFDSERPMIECHQVGGFKPKDVQSILNWKEDVQKWAENNQCTKGQ